jgi:hypothetical protein
MNSDEESAQVIKVAMQPRFNALKLAMNGMEELINTGVLDDSDGTPTTLANSINVLCIMIMIVMKSSGAEIADENIIEMISDARELIDMIDRHSTNTCSDEVEN